ncbi:MAG: NACHT domain-containing protein [Nostoc sp. TH1S01]|nr:NACHT domain-containing protein [Nostoc sp. TH1S01]
MLKSQQEAAILRRKATERGFEINVYVPLGLVERKQQQRRQQDEQQDRENVYELTEEVIVKTYEHGAFLREVIAQQPAEKNKHIAIIGEPGAGKTTLLSTIASFIKDNTQDLPICISLASLQGKTIEKYLREQWLTEAMSLVKPDVKVTSEIERQLLACFAKGGVWLLLDGVDEMGENSPVQALAKINRELTAPLRQARVVLTCRSNVWDAQVNNLLTGFDTYKTQEFKPKQIDNFIQQWFERADNLTKGKTLQAKLKETKHENIRKLVTNPLRLSLLCQTFDLDKQGELPETKAALYQRFSRYLYEWKSELFPDLYDSDDLKDELHGALSRLAFAGINTKARFRLTKSLARQEMGERLFQIARDSFWLVLVDRTTETDEEVYAFFHPNFQEYFAALAVDDWDLFLPRKHKNKPVKNKKYRIFESQWKEVILLWLGREEQKLKQQKQDFIDALVNFKDGCGKWHSEDIDKGFYEYRAYFLAAVGIAEFRAYSRTDEIVEQIVKWGFGYSPKKHKWGTFYNPIQQEARSAIQQTERIKAVAALEQLLDSRHLDEDIRIQVAESLETINPGNNIAITALLELLQSPDIDYLIRDLAAESLGKIGTGNKTVITAFTQLLPSLNVRSSIRFQIIESLGKINPDNEWAITTLEKQQSTDVDTKIHKQIAQILEATGTGNENEKIAILVELLHSTTLNDDDTHYWQAVESLGEINTGNEFVVTALIKLLESPYLDIFTAWQAAGSLGKILQKDKDCFEVVKTLSGWQSLYGKYYDLVWKCAYIMRYPDFYQAWRHPYHITIQILIIIFYILIHNLKKILFTRII